MRFNYSSFHRIKYIYLAALLMALHVAFTVYINSTYLSSAGFSPKEVGLLYTSGAVLTVMCLIASTSIVRRVRNFNFFITALCIEIIALLGLFLTNDPILIKLFFIIHQATPPLLLFGLDLFLEGSLRSEKNTGGVHSLYLTAQNTAFVLSPFLVGKIVTFTTSYQIIYLLSAIFCILLLILAFDELRRIRTRKLHEINFIDSVEKFLPHRNLNRVFLINFLLHAFYAGMVIYMPMYLHETIGFSWQSIGLIFTIMLLPFVLFEAPLGKIFDKIHLEREAIITGFCIISLSTMLIFFTQSSNFYIWAALLFMSRMGASFVEIGIEYAFFKRVSDHDAGFISIYRMAGPAAYIVAPLIASSLVRVLPIQYIFLVISIVVLMGIAFSYKLRTLKN